MKHKQEKVARQISHYAAEFLQTISSSSSMITVTSATISPDLRKTTILISVLPDSDEDETIEKLSKKKREFQSYLAKKIKYRNVPSVEFKIDRGEENRRRIEALSK